MMKGKRILILAIFVASLLLPALAMADNDPRDGIPAPGGTDIFLFYYRQFTGSDFYVDGETLDGKTDFDFNLAIARYAHFVSLGKWTWSYDIVQPFGSMKLESEALGIDDTGNGLGDTCAATHINTPWLIESEAMKYGMSAGFYLTMPFGDYDMNEAVNIGANRWAYKLEFTPVIWQVGALTLELTGDVQFYGDNDEYTAASANLEQDPLFGLQTHLSYDINDSFWIGVSHFFYTGGETTVGDLAMDDKTETQALRFTGAIKLAPQVQLLLQYHTELERENGVEQNYIGTRLAYFW